MVHPCLIDFQRTLRLCPQRSDSRLFPLSTLRLFLGYHEYPNRVNNVYRLHTLKFTCAWHKGILPKVFDHFFQYASNVHHYNTRYAAKQNFELRQILANEWSHLRP